jgi:hypothetical protein
VLVAHFEKIIHIQQEYLVIQTGKTSLALLNNLRFKAAVSVPGSFKIKLS